MKKLIALGLLAVMVAFAGTAFAGIGKNPETEKQYAGWPTSNPAPTFFGPNTAG